MTAIPNVTPTTAMNNRTNRAIRPASLARISVTRLHLQIDHAPDRETALDAAVDDLCAAEPFLVWYGKVRFSTVGRIRSEGFPLIPTLDRPHYDIVLPDLHPPTVERLDRCFDPPVPNPGRR